MTQSDLNVASRGSSQDGLIDLCSSPTSTELSTSQAIIDWFKKIMSGWIVVMITISPLLSSRALPARIEHDQQVRVLSQNSRSLYSCLHHTSRYLLHVTNLIVKHFTKPQIYFHDRLNNLP